MTSNADSREMLSEIIHLRAVLTAFGLNDQLDAAPAPHPENPILEIPDCDSQFGYDALEIERCKCIHFWDEAIGQSINCPDYEPIYWYHPDYLGHTDFVTDRTGQPYQHFFYAPFGEALLSQHTGTGYYNTPYRFNAKELDSETGLIYYGARYYEPKESVWLSVDPLAHKYPGLSGYNFVANNPIMLVDPDGKEAIAPNLDEWIVNVETGITTWASPLGGDEVQIVNYTDNEGMQLGQHIIEGSQAFVGRARDGWIASQNNLWENLSDDYNSRSGYEYSTKDLRMRFWVLNSPNSYHGFSSTIRNSEASGMAGPVSASEYWNEYGHDLGNLILARFYIENAVGFASGNGSISGHRRMGAYRQPGSWGLAPAGKNATSGTPMQLQSGSISNHPWIRFLQNSKGTYSGENWMNHARTDYYKQKQ